MLNTDKKILVVGPSWVGDMVMAQSLFMALKANNPDCLIDVLAPQWSLPLLDRMPQVNTGIPMPLGHGQFDLSARYRLGKSLRGKNYQQAILLPNSWKSALIPFFANIKQRTGYLGEQRWGLLNEPRKLDKQFLTMTVQRFVALAYPADQKQLPDCPVPVLKIPENSPQQLIEKFKLTQNNKILALCPGAEYGPAKRWPVEHYAELATEKLDQGWNVFLFGSAKDQPVAEQINALANHRCQDFSGKTSLAEAVDLMSLADVVVSNDSGLMHVAAALNKQVIAIYGSSDPNFTPPLNASAKVINLNLECSPCFKRECPLAHTRCLYDISPQQILAEMD